LPIIIREIGTPKIQSCYFRTHSAPDLFTIAQSDSRGMRSGFQGFLQAAFVAKLIFLRFAQKNAMFSGGDSMINFWKAGRLHGTGRPNLAHL
jgi:hypothetical protein